MNLPLQRLALTVAAAVTLVGGAGCSTAHRDAAATLALSQAASKSTGLGITYRNAQELDVARLTNADRQAVASHGSRFEFEGKVVSGGAAQRVWVRNLRAKPAVTLTLQASSVTVAGPGGAPMQMPRTAVPEIVLPVSLADLVAAASQPTLHTSAGVRRVTGSLTSKYAAAGNRLQQGTFELTLSADGGPRHLSVILKLAVDTPLPSGSRRIGIVETFEQDYGPTTPAPTPQLSTVRQITDLFSAR